MVALAGLWGKVGPWFELVSLSDAFLAGFLSRTNLSIKLFLADVFGRPNRYIAPMFSVGALIPPQNAFGLDCIRVEESFLCPPEF